ncbi:MAG: FG-GAP-like repeat-containing protein [bacterium]
MSTRFNLLIALTLTLVLGSCVNMKVSTKKTKPEMTLKSATALLTTHAIHDAVMVVPNGTWHSSPALADIDNDGDLEVIVAVGERWVGAWHHDGRPVTGWPQFSERIVCSPAVADVNNDGQLEIVTPGHLWHADGQLMPGWSTGRGNSFCTPSLADIDADGDLEILYSDFEKGVCIRHHDGTMLTGWPITVPDNDVRCTPLAFDIDGDGKKEIVFTRREGEVRIYRLDGTPLPGFPKQFSGLDQQCFVFADVNNDTKTELVTAGKAINLLDGSIIKLTGSGGGTSPCLVRNKITGKLDGINPRLPRDIDFKLPPDISGDNSWWTDNVTVADIDGDGELEILFGNRAGGYHAYRNNGTQSAGWPKRLNPAADCGMTVGDLDGDGTLEVVANAGGGRIYVFGCPGSADGEVPWPMFMANTYRNGIINLISTPRARKNSSVISPEIKSLHQALAASDWDKAMALYYQSIAVIEKNTNKLGKEQVKSLKQSGLLSIARILNTRARRFNEAADMYQQAISIAPETWTACQSLAECFDLVMLHQEVTTAKPSLDKAVTQCLSRVKTLPMIEADIYRYVVAQSCVLLERQNEGMELFQTIVQNKKAAVPPNIQQSDQESRRQMHYLNFMASENITYEGLPFLISFQEEQSVHVKTKAKDLTATSPVEANKLYQLEINPHSAVLEAFPVHMHCEIDPEPTLRLEGNWTTGSNGRLVREDNARFPSADINTNVTNRLTLFSKPYTENEVTVQRAVERIDDTHMKVKFFFQTRLFPTEFGFMTRETEAKIIPSSVTPKNGILYCNENEVRFSTIRLDRNATIDISTGFNIEAMVELAKDRKSFYPEVLVRAWGGGDEISVQPRTPTKSISGLFAGAQYTLSSPRKFKLNSARTDLFWAFTLEMLDAE